jgi:hypothetical protein
MYEAHRQNPRPESTDWAILSPDVPVFRKDDGTTLERPWLLSFITCAAPFAPGVGQPKAGDLLQRRILRVLAIARACGYVTLVLGAWGCGAFENDPQRTAAEALEFLEPILDEDHFGHGLGLPLFHLHHHESLAVEGDVPASHWRCLSMSSLLKQEAGFAGREACVRSNIHRPHLILPPVEQLLPVPCPKRLCAALKG